MKSLVFLTYRYISVLLKEAEILWTAYSLRAPGQRGIHISAWGSFLGQLLLRSMDKANELYQSMIQRGFRGNFDYLTVPVFTGRDLVFLAVSGSFFLLARFYDLTAALGGLML